MSQLCALVVQLRLLRRCEIKNYLGRAVYFRCRQLLKRSDTQLATHIHDAQENKPFVASGLFARDMTRSIWGKCAPGEVAWIRLVGLNSEVVEALQVFVKTPPAVLEIHYIPWEIMAIQPDHPWAGQCTYAEIARRHHIVPPGDEYHLEFASPSSFHSQGVNMPMPLPRLVFKSLLKRWLWFSGYEAPPYLSYMDDFLEYLVVLSRYRLETSILHFKSEGQEVGFTGLATFEILARNAKLKYQKPESAEKIEAYHTDLSRMIGLLCEFAFYSGVGIKTAMGMGMVQQV